MNKVDQTEQDCFWAGKFGDEYSKHNVGEQWFKVILHFLQQFSLDVAVSVH